MVFFRYMLLIVGAWFFNPFTYISEVNTLQKEAANNYNKGQVSEATLQYLYLLRELGIESEPLNLNLAHSYFRLNQTKDATFFYKKVIAESNNKILKSIALTQLGVITQPQSSTEEALSIFKEAILLWAENSTARYNYELLKKRLQQETPQDSTQQQQDNQDQQEDSKDQTQKKQDPKGKKQNTKQKDEQGKDEVMDTPQANKNGDKTTKQAKGNETKSDQNVDTEKLDEMNLNLEKANMILEAMKNQEIQYLQQTTRKLQQEQQDREQERLKRNKPDW